MTTALMEGDYNNGDVKDVDGGGMMDDNNNDNDNDGDCD
jgi:hypothetical protein